MNNIMPQRPDQGDASPLASAAPSRLVDDARHAPRKSLCGRTRAPSSTPTGLETGEDLDSDSSALAVKKEWLNLIFSGRKKWEIRGTATTKRGPIEFIESGSGYVVGEAKITDSFPLAREDLHMHVDKHCIQDVSIIKYRKIFAWVLADAQRYKDPQPYDHPVGAITWVKRKMSASSSSSSVRL